MVEHGGDIAVVAVCRDLPALLAAVGEHEPDVVVTDIRMPPTGTDEGIHAAAELRDSPSRHRRRRALASTSSRRTRSRCSTDGSDRPCLPAEGAGLRPRTSSSPPSARSPRGGSVIDPKVVEVLVNGATGARRSPLDQLTPTRTGDARRDRPGQEQRRHRRLAVPQRAGRREAHQLDLLQARPHVSETDVHRRVKAVLLFLSEPATSPAGVAPPPDGPGVHPVHQRGERVTHGITWTRSTQAP